MAIITDFEEIRKCLKSLTKVADGYHEISCKKCEHNGLEEWCSYCEGGFWYQFGIEFIQCQNGACQLCQKNTSIIIISGNMAVLDNSNEPEYRLYTSEDHITQAVAEKQKFLLSLCYECRIKNGGVEIFEIVSVS